MQRGSYGISLSAFRGRKPQLAYQDNRDALSSLTNNSYTIVVTPSILKHDLTVYLIKQSTAHLPFRLSVVISICSLALSIHVGYALDSGYQDCEQQHESSASWTLTIGIFMTKVIMLSAIGTAKQLS